MTERKYKTEKAKLQARCKAKGIKVAQRWTVAELKVVLETGKPPKRTGRPKKNAPKRAPVCSPVKCTCERTVDAKRLDKFVLYEKPLMRTELGGYHWDGVRFSRYNCTCGQVLIVRTPMKWRVTHCPCGKRAAMWKADGKASCVPCSQPLK